MLSRSNPESSARAFHPIVRFVGQSTLLLTIGLSFAGPAKAASWVCGAISASGNGTPGWSVSSSRSQAENQALSQCRSKGGSGCFITGCEYGVGQTPEEAARNQPTSPPRVFNNAPKKEIVRKPTRQQPSVARKPPVTVSKPAKQKPATAATQGESKPKTSKAGTNSAGTTNTGNSGCRKPFHRLPTAKKIEVDPCADQSTALKNVYVPQSKLKHQGPAAERYIQSLANCKEISNGVCIDADRKLPIGGVGGPIDVTPR
jgi:hypothetical protein